jgi:hypothetical protein
MAFTNPIWLWGLTGLSVPLAIHLLSRKEGQVIAIGSLRHLQDANTQQFKSLRLNEILLLILRSLVIISIVFFLAGLSSSTTSREKWVLLEENLKGKSEANMLVDSLKKQGYELRSFSSGFPLVSNSLVEPINYWQLLEELKSKALTSAVIISSSRLESFRGLQIQKPDAIQWLTVPPVADNYLVSAKKITTDSIVVKMGALKNQNTHHSSLKTQNLNGTGVYKIKNDSIAITPIDTIKIILIIDVGFEYDGKILLASLNALKSFVPSKLQIELATDLKASLRNYDWIIWLSEKGEPSDISNKKIIFKENPHHKILEQKSATEWRLTTHLNQGKVLDENLTHQLSQLLVPAKPEWHTANSKDQRGMPEKMMWADSEVTSRIENENASLLSLEQPFVILILILLVIERLVSYKRNQ